jgi:hypothetical protein
VTEYTPQEKTLAVQNCTLFEVICGGAIWIGMGLCLALGSLWKTLWSDGGILRRVT